MRKSIGLTFADVNWNRTNNAIPHMMILV